MSPSLRGSGLKSLLKMQDCWACHVSLFTRERIEMHSFNGAQQSRCVSLFTRERIEMIAWRMNTPCRRVSLFTRERIEIL